MAEVKLEVKDFRETDTLERCLILTHHHMAVMTTGIVYQDDRRQWINRAEANLDGVKKALEQVRKIRDFARRTSNTELMALLDEKFLFCDSPELKAHDQRVKESQR